MLYTREPAHRASRTPGDWGQVPEEGNPTADFDEGTLHHKPFARAWHVPFPDAMPYKVKPARQHGGTWPDEPEWDVD